MPTSAGVAYVEVVPDTKGFTAALSSGVQKQSAGFMSKAKAFGAQWGALIGVGLGIGFAKSSLGAFDDFEKASETLQVGLDKIHQPQAFDEITAWASDFADQTGILEADILTMSSRLANMGSAFFKAVGPDAAAELEKLTGGFEDMAAATGKSVNMLMRSLGPAILNTPDKAITLLQKYGVLTDAQAAKTKALTDAGNNLAATELEINAIQAAFGGTAARTATAYSKLGERINKVEIIVGGLISQALGPLIPILDAVVKNADLLLGTFAAYEAIKWLPVMFSALGTAVADLIPGIGILTGEMGSLAAAETAAATAGKAAGISFLGLTTGPLAAIAAGVIVVKTAVDALDKALGQKTADAMAEGGAALDAWVQKVNDANGLTHGWLGFLLGSFVPGWKGVQSATQDAADTLGVHEEAVKRDQQASVNQTRANIEVGRSMDLLVGRGTDAAQSMVSLQTAAGQAADAADRLKDAQNALNDELRTTWSLENQAAGGLVGLAQADSDASSAKRDLAAAEAKVNQLRAAGKKGTAEYTAATRDLRAAELASINAQAGLDSAAQSAYATFRKGNVTLAEADARLRAQAQAAGLSAGETNRLVAQVNALYAADRKIPSDVATTYLASGLAGNLADLARYNQYLAGLDGKQVFITVHTSYVEHGSAPAGGIQS